DFAAKLPRLGDQYAELDSATHEWTGMRLSQNRKGTLTKGRFYFDAQFDRIRHSLRPGESGYISRDELLEIHASWPKAKTYRLRLWLERYPDLLVHATRESVTAKEGISAYFYRVLSDDHALPF